MITPFISWQSISSGTCRWTNERECQPVDPALGVRLEVEKATRTAPFLERTKPWETGLAWAQVMRDGGKIRMWYGVTRGFERKDDLLCYAESHDGKSWHKPDLGLVSVDGSTENNAVIQCVGANHGCVMIDPTATPEKRYRCMFMLSGWKGDNGEDIDNVEGHRRHFARERGEKNVPAATIHGHMVGFNSPDGLCWTRIEGTIMDEWHDTHNICEYDEKRGKSVGYFRCFHDGRRAVSYSETDDFENWPPTQPIYAAELMADCDASIYSPCYTRYPDVPNLYLMFPGMYHTTRDHVNGHLAVSSDGRIWSGYTDGPIIEHGAPGDRDEAFVYPEPQLLRFSEDGKFRLPLKAGMGYHNEWCNESLRDNILDTGCFEWAEWAEDRLAGVVADDDGSFTTTDVRCGDGMSANYRTEPDGWIRFELTASNKMLDGFGFDDGETFTGDHVRQPVTWKGNGDLSGHEGRKVAVRVKMHKAKLFSITMHGAEDAPAARDPRLPV